MYSCRGFETRNLHEGVKSPPRGEVLDDVSVRKFSFLHRHVLLQPVDNSFLKLRHLLLLLLRETAQSKSTLRPLMIFDSCSNAHLISASPLPLPPSHLVPTRHLICKRKTFILISFKIANYLLNLVFL